jgi:ABC-2 type transport system permease protein
VSQPDLATAGGPPPEPPAGPSPAGPPAPGLAAAPTPPADDTHDTHDTDVIHDIGYRAYDGPRLGRGHARKALFSQSLRGAYGLGRSAKSKVLPMILLGVMCAPALIMVAVAVFTT